MNIIGISCYYHDAAAVLIRDGVVIAGAEEERFSRKKHDSDFPKNALEFCLEKGKCTRKDIDYVVFYEKPFTKLHRIFTSSIALYPQSHLSFRDAMRLWISKKLWIKQTIQSFFEIDENKILFSEHHLSHAASCFYPSPFKKSAILTIDGVGEWTTTAKGVGTDNKINLTAEINFPQSIGLLYSAFTAFLGFEVNEGEWKVMGLAPYGKPKYTAKVYKMVKKLPDGSFKLDLSYFSFHYSSDASFSKKFVNLFGDPIAPNQSHLITTRSADIAASIQAVSEELLLAMAKSLRAETGLDNLCMAGGVALNSVANYKILQKSGFKNIFIQPAAGDSGGALGSALYVHHHVLNHKKRFPINSVYFGKEYSDKNIQAFLDSVKAVYKKVSYSDLTNYISGQLKNGKVIGWFQGPFEWGPRALGNRSILADPRNPKMKDIINAKVKFREAFRPFAPSILAEYAGKVFDVPKNLTTHHPLRYMLYVVNVKSNWRKKVPAITHADNSTRPQIVMKEFNPLYHRLITEFYRKTKVPLVLNTSFNLRGEPIVNSPADAYNTFMRSGIDILVINHFILEKSPSLKQ